MSSSLVACFANVPAQRPAAYASKNGMAPINMLSGVHNYAVAEERGSLIADRLMVSSSFDKENILSALSLCHDGSNEVWFQEHAQRRFGNSVAWQAFNLILTPVQDKVSFGTARHARELDAAGFVFISARRPLRAVDILRTR